MGFRQGRINQLQKLAEGGNSADLSQQQQLASESFAMQIKGAVGGEGKPRLGEDARAALATEAAQAQQQLQTGLQQQAGARALQAGGQAIQLTEREKKSKLAARKVSLMRQQRTLQREFFQLSKSKGEELFQQQYRFQKDAMGQTLFTQRQFADLAILKAKSEQEVRDLGMRVQQESERKLRLFQATQRAIAARLEQEMQRQEAYADFQLRQRLVAAEKAMRKKIEREKAEAANRLMLWRVGGTIVGTAIGAYAGNPVLGAQIGSSAGTFLGSVTE